MDDYYGEDELEEIFIDFAQCKDLDVGRFEALMGYFNDLSEKGREDMVSWMIEEIRASEGFEIEEEFKPILWDGVHLN